MDHASNQAPENARSRMLLIQRKQITDVQLTNVLGKYLITYKRLRNIREDEEHVLRAVVDYYYLEQYRMCKSV